MDAAGERRRGGASGRGVRPARERRVGRGQALPGRDVRRARRAAPSSSAGATRGRSTTSPARRGVEHRVIPWDEVTLDEGTGIVHIAPGCGARGLRAVEASTTCRCSRRSTRRAASTTTTAGCTGSRRPRRPTRSSASSASAGFLVEAGLYAHRYPHCWRCDTPLIFRDRRRLVHLRRRAAPADARRERDGRVDAAQYMGKRMDDWLRNMGDWNISRRRYYGLPLPFYPCACGHLNVIGSRAELDERAVEGLDQLEELHRPWIDRVPIRCEQCGEACERIPEVGDVWLDAGIVPFSTLGWENPEWVAERLRDRRGARAHEAPTCPTTPTGRSGSRPTGSPRCASRSGSGSTRSSSCRSCCVGRAPFRRVLGYEKMLDEHGPRDARLVGEHDSSRGRVRADGRGRHALAVLRAAAGPQPALRLRARRTRSSASC